VTTRAERVVEGLQALLLQVEISKIIVHEAGEPNAAVDFLDAEFLPGQRDSDVDPLTMQAEAATGGDKKLAIVERIDQFGQAAREGGGANRVPSTILVKSSANGLCNAFASSNAARSSTCTGVIVSFHCA